MQTEEERLVKRAMRQNPKAFGTLVRMHQDYLYRIAFQNSYNEQDALDAVQDGILNAYQHLHSLKNPQYFKTWLTRIVMNAAKDILRKRKPEVPLETLPEQAAPQEVSAEERMDLYLAMDRLPENYRHLLRLKYFEGLTIREIATRTETPQGTISVYLSRALQELRKELNREELYICRKL